MSFFATNPILDWKRLHWETNKFVVAAVADGRGVAAYYSSKAQLDGLSQTDILERYRSFAQEHVCKGRILWTPESDVA